MTAWHLSVHLGGFQNPGVCLQAFPSFPPPPSFTRSVHHLVFLCSQTAQKHLLRRLGVQEKWEYWLLEAEKEAADFAAMR